MPPCWFSAWFLKHKGKCLGRVWGEGGRCASGTRTERGAGVRADFFPSHPLLRGRQQGAWEK